MTGRKSDEHVIARNRAATFHYELSDRYEAGIVLRGSEVKALREGRVHLVDAFAVVERGEVWLKHLHIAPFFYARAVPHDERSARKLLLHVEARAGRSGCSSSGSGAESAIRTARGPSFNRAPFRGSGSETPALPGDR